MGIGVAAGVMAGVAVAGAAGDAYEQQQAARSENEQLSLISSSQQLQYQQKTLANYGQLQQMLSTQQAQATAAGVNLGSGSLNAIQQNTLNVGARTQSNLNIESMITQNDIESERNAVNNTMFARMFMDLGGAGKAGAQYAASVPTASNANDPNAIANNGAPTYNPNTQYGGFGMDFSS